MEKETDKEKLLANFYSMDNFNYANLLIQNFGKERVTKELDSYLEMTFFPRKTGSIKLPELIKSITELEISNSLEANYLI